MQRGRLVPGVQALGGRVCDTVPARIHSHVAAPNAGAVLDAVVAWVAVADGTHVQLGRRTPDASAVWKAIILGVVVAGRAPIAGCGPAPGSGAVWGAVILGVVIAGSAAVQ